VTHADPLTQAQAVQRKIRAAEARIDKLRAERDRHARAALAAGAKPVHLAHALGLTRARIAQLYANTEEDA